MTPSFVFYSSFGGREVLGEAWRLRFSRCQNFFWRSDQLGMQGSAWFKIFDIIRWVSWLMGQSSLWPSIWCSKYYFFLQLYKDENKEFWVPEVQASIQLFYFQCIKMILGPPDAWSMRRFTQRPTLLYWRLSYFWCSSLENSKSA